MIAHAQAFAPALVLARYTLLEATKSRLGVVALAAAACGLGLAAFVDALALTDSAGIRGALLAALYRLAAAFLAASFVVTTIVREEADKGVELLLSLPLSRVTYLAGKWLGFALVALLLALLFGASVAFAGGAGTRAAAWAFSLFLELLVVVSLSLAFVLSFRHVTSALAGIAAFYVLSRSMSAIVAITASPVAPADSAAFRFAGLLVEVIAALLPRLDAFARTEWITGESAPALAMSLLQAPVYVVLLLVIAHVDLARRNL